MKTFLAALLLMVIITGFATVNTRFILRKTDELLTMAEAFPENAEQFLAKKDALAHEVAAFTALWDRTIPFLCYASNYQNFSRADEAVSLLHASIQGDSATDFIVARADFLCAMRRFHDFESISFSSVF